MVIYVEFNEKKLYLRKSGHLFYFSPKKEGALDEVPEGYKIKYGKSGFPVIKKI
mgnify:CR=1 FL=1